MYLGLKLKGDVAVVWLEPKKTLVAFNIEGTLEGYGGIIKQDTLRMLCYFSHVALISNRGDTNEIANKLGLGWACVGKRKALREYEKAYPTHIGKVYIADTEEDRKEAYSVGWNFVDVNNIKLNLGCGEDIRKGWINIDRRIIKGIDLCYDISEHAIPLQDKVVAEILCKDFIEHLSWRRVEYLLHECFRVLKSNGLIYIQTPDLEAIAKQVVLNPDFKSGDLYGWKAIGFWVYGRQDEWGEYHRCGFTIPTLKRLLESIGFNVERIENNGGSNILCWARRP